MGLKQIVHGSADYQKMVKLRHELLRKPQGLDFSEADLQKEADDILIAAFDEDVIIGCCILTPLPNKTVRLRQMAVAKNKQGKGIGESMLLFAETLARDKGFKTLMMHARDTTISYYEKYGFAVKGGEFTEVNLQHHVMEKILR
jgi:N-acetylglutamate synthase-like GNAT family acetyltransferase